MHHRTFVAEEGIMRTRAEGLFRSGLEWKAPVQFVSLYEVNSYSKNRNRFQA
jgi:hypothetical protein